MTRYRAGKYIVLATVLMALIPVTNGENITAGRPAITANITLFSHASVSPLSVSLGVDTGAVNLTRLSNDTLPTAQALQAIIENTDIFFIDRYFPADQGITSLVASLVNGTAGSKGLVVFGLLENDIDATTMAAFSSLFPVTILENFTSQVSTDNTNDAGYKVQVGLVDEIPTGSEAISASIGWTSCPAISRRLVIDAKPGASKVVEVTAIGYEGNSILTEWDVPGNGGHVMFYSVVLDLNKPFYLWPYFNYLMYVSVFQSLDGYPADAIEAFHEWPHAPIPNPVQEITWFLLVAAMGAVTVIITFRFKRRGDLGQIQSNEVTPSGSR